jgi:RNA polymerase sigma factor FliA
MRRDSSVATNAMNPVPPGVVVEEYFSLVRAIARKIKCRVPAFVDVDDLVQTGMLGLFEASRRYDPSRAKDFSSYANPRITGAILDELRRLDRCSRQNRRTARASEEAAHRLRLTLGQEPTRQEIASAVGLGLDEYDRVLQRLEAAKEQSNSTALSGPDDREVAQLPAPDRSPLEQCSRKEEKKLIRCVLNHLSPKQRKVLELYYFEEMGLREIGEKMGLGEARVCQIHRQALRELRKKMESSAQLARPQTFRVQ